MGSLTVFETILFAAMMKLPTNMSNEDKYSRVYEILVELDILHIAHSLVGDDTGISGGERRRVSIGCELVRNPSVLILDEPSSGLDSYNAYNVIECLSLLATEHKKTVIISIHQPRSNIVALFNDVLLLAHGRMLYCGQMNSCASYFQNIGFKVPVEYNIADYLGKFEFKCLSVVDLAMNFRHEDNVESMTLAEKRSNRLNTGKSSESLVDSLANMPLLNNNEKELSEHVDNLEALFLASDLHKTNLESILQSQATSTHINATDIDKFKPGFKLQLQYLLERSFKNVFRNSYLFTNHLVMSLFIGVSCGILFWQVSLDLGGFQNRLGLFFFVCTVFAFSCLSSVHVSIIT